MSLAQLFYLKETFRERVRRWRRSQGPRGKGQGSRGRSALQPDTQHSKREPLPYPTPYGSRFTLESLEPRLLLSVTVPQGELASLDVDLNGQADALTDGVVIIRHLFGYSGPALTDGAVDPAGQRTDPTAIANYLESIRPSLNVDLNQQADALTDGLVIMRSLFGFTGASLTDGVVDPGGGRTDPAVIATFLDNMNPQREVIAPLVTAGLQQDSGVSATDGVTNTATIIGTIADLNQIVSFTAGFDSIPLANFTDIESHLLTTGDFTLTPTTLAQLAGGTLADGVHTLHLPVTDANGNVSSISDLVFTLDSTAPTVVSAPTGVLTDVMTSMTVAFSEAMSQTVFSLSSYQLLVNGGSNDGQSVAIHTIEQMDAHTARLTFANPLINQGYRLTIDPVVSDLAGNALAPVSTASPFQVMVPTVQWINPTSGFWDVAANWSTGTVPGLTDDVLIDVPGDITVTTDQGSPP